MPDATGSAWLLLKVLPLTLSVPPLLAMAPPLLLLAPLARVSLWTPKVTPATVNSPTAFPPLMVTALPLPSSVRSLVMLIGPPPAVRVIVPAQPNCRMLPAAAAAMAARSALSVHVVIAPGRGVAVRVGAVVGVLVAVAV